MEKNIKGSIKIFFNILRNDKNQIINDDALNEIIDLFIFYMLGSNDDNNKQFQLNEDDTQDLKNKINNIIKTKHLEEDEIKFLLKLDRFEDLNNSININNFDKKGLEISNDDDIDYLLYFLNYDNFYKFYCLTKDDEYSDKINQIGKSLDEILNNFEYMFKKYNLDVRYKTLCGLTPLFLYKEIRRIFHYHKYFKNIFTNEETLINDDNTFEDLIKNLDKFKDYKDNEDFDFFGQLYESLYTDYFFGSTKGKSSKNAMGQFFTPQYITDFLIMLIHPQTFKNPKNNNINIGNFAELSMGSGGIIRSYMKWYNLLYHKKFINNKLSKNEINNKKLLIHNNLKKQFLNHITGCEKSERVFTLCAANMIMRTGNYMKSLKLGDSIFNEDKDNNIIFNKLYDYICINPPFFITYNFDKINKKFDLDNFPLYVGGKNSEWLFIILTLQKLKINGKAAVIVPENNHLYETSGNYHILRELLIRCCEIHKIIRCESGTFTSTSAPTVIIYFTKKNNIDDVLSYILKKGYDFSSNIDFEEDNKTKSVSKYADIKSYVLDKNILNTNSISFYDFKDFKDITMEDIINNKKNINDIKPIKIIELKELEKNNFSFMFNDYINKNDLQIKLNDDNIIYKKLEEIVNYGKKSNRNAEFGKDKGMYNFYCSSEKVKKCDIADYNEEYIIIGDGGVANVKIDNKFSCTNHNFIFKSKNKEEILNKYIYYYLKFNKRILQEFYTGMMIKNINKNDLNKINIPIISIEKQKKIIEYIESEIFSKYDIELLNKRFNNTNTFNLLLQNNFEIFKEIYYIESTIILNINILNNIEIPFINIDKQDKLINEIKSIKMKLGMLENYVQNLLPYLNDKFLNSIKDVNINNIINEKYDEIINNKNDEEKSNDEDNE